MSKIARDVDSWKVHKIVQKAYRDDICLPDFQREFVWDQEQCAKLVESILRQYPIGTLMLLEAQGNESFGKRSFTERSNIPLNSDYYVIDGQQRIITLLKLLFTPKEFQTSDPIKFNEKTYKFYYRASIDPDFFNKEDVDKPSFIMPVRKELDEKDYWNKKEFPLEFIFSLKHIDRWLNKTHKNGKKRRVAEIRKRLIKVRDILSKYKCPVEKIEGRLNSRDHYNMFQLLNQEGTDLTIFDLLVAKLNPLGVKLRDLWERAQMDHRRLQKRSFDIDPTYILKVIALIKGTREEAEGEEARPSCSKKDLKRLYKKYENCSRNEFLHDWECACSFVEEAITDMQFRYGVVTKKYVPYYPMIVTIAAIKWWYKKEQKASTCHKDTMQEKIDRWYWGSIFNQEYDSHTDETISIHYQALRKWVQPRPHKKIPEEINFRKKFNKRAILEMIDDIDSSADARYKAILCMPMAGDRKAKDILSDIFLEAKPEKLQDHHVYPQKILKDTKKYEPWEINQIANRVLITGPTNGQIHAHSPYEYLPSVKKGMMDQYFLFSSIYTQKMDYREFIEKRKPLLVKRILELIMGW